VIAFTVCGVPKPKGSPRPLKLGNGRTILSIHQTDDALAWEHACIHEAGRHRPELVMTGPVRATLRFWIPRPKSVRREHPTARPDLDKLVRCLLDAVTVAQLIADDAQVVELSARKDYCKGRASGVDVTLEPLTATIGA
jgi:Holliday junction resolvase RusA-like endonuclease